MSGSITGGSVHFLKRIKTGDYEHAEAVAIINFAVDEKTEHTSVVNLARSTALSTVYTALGLKAPAGGDAVIVQTSTAAGDGAKEAVAARRGRRATTPPPNPEPAAGEEFDPLKAGEAGADAGSSSQAEVQAGSADAGEFDPLSGSNGGSAGSELKSDDTSIVTAEDDIFSAEAEAVSDETLMSNITAKNAETKNTQAIRKLIGKYTPQDGKPHTAKEVPADKRQAFLIELAAVPKAE